MDIIKDYTMPDREKNCQKRILKILDYAKDGLEFLKKSDETDFQKKIEESGIQFVTSLPIPDDPLRLAAMVLQLAHHKIKPDDIHEYLESQNDTAVRPVD